MHITYSLSKSMARVAARIELADGSQADQKLENTTAGCLCELLSGGQVHL